MRDRTQQLGNDIMIPAPNRVRHLLNSETKTTMGIGTLTPFFFQETCPGDEIILSHEQLVRLMPLSSPLMHKMELVIDYFYVPNRIVWDNWETFIMRKKDSLTNQAPLQPYFNRTLIGRDAINPAHTNPRLCGYFKLLPEAAQTAADVFLNPMHLAAYQAIWSHHYRHPLVQEEIKFKLSDGDIGGLVFNEITKMRNVLFRDDYFNAMLPSPQQGEPIFIDQDAPVRLNYSDPNVAGLDSTWADAFGLPVKAKYERSLDNQDGIRANELYAEVQLRIEELRRASALQKLVEAERHSQKYNDYLKVNHNVNYPDYRLDQPQHICGHRQAIVVSEVTNTADENQGRITGNGGSYANSGTEKFYAHEHGMVIGVAYVTYPPVYIDAAPRFNTKLNALDYYNPMLDGLGERAIKSIELSASSDLPNEDVGYVPNYWEYRKAFDVVSGEMTLNYAHWHLARAIEPRPQLTEDFYDVVDERRIFMFQRRDYDPVVLQVYTNISVERNIPRIPEPVI